MYAIIILCFFVFFLRIYDTKHMYIYIIYLEPKSPVCFHYKRPLVFEGDFHNLFKTKVDLKRVQGGLCS